MQLGLSGAWSNPDGHRTRPVRLTRVGVAAKRLARPGSPGPPRSRAEDPYSFLNQALLQNRQLDAASDALDCRGNLDSEDQGGRSGWARTTAVTCHSARPPSLRET